MSFSMLWLVVALPLASGAEPTPRATGAPPSATWNPVTFANVLTGLPAAYYDPQSLPPKRAFRSGLTRLERGVPEVLVSGPDARGVLTVTVRGRQRRFPSADLKTWMEMGDRLLGALRWIDGVLGERDRRDRLQYAAIKGVLSALDPHTVFFTPEEYRQQRSRFTGSMVGIGVTLRAVRGAIVVVALVPGGPAQKAGLRVGDVLVQVGALSMTNLSPAIAAGRLRGKEGTRVQVVISRRGRRRTFTLVRREIELPSVTTRMLPGRVALVTISGFPKNALQSFEKAIAPVRRKRPRAWVLDLRGNEGGYILQAARIADHFLQAGLICKAVGRGGQKVVRWKVQPKPHRITAPLVVLVNRRTASAAEILAGTLSVNDRALLLGEPTWGKGTVQKLYPMPDGSALKLTMWQYLLAGDIPIQTEAIVPDLELLRVSITPRAIRYITAGRAENEASQRGHLHAMRGKHAWKGRPVRPALRYVVGGPAGPDPVLRLAREIAARARGPRRRDLLATAAPLLKALRAKQRQLVQARFKKQHIHWAAAAAAAPRLTARFTPARLEGKAGAALALTLEVKNPGATAAEDVFAVLSGYHDALDGREILFGHIAAGGSLTRTLKVDLPGDLRARTELLRANVGSGAHRGIARAYAVVRMRERPRPRFQLAWQLDDRKGGNGDGILGPGETAALRLVVKNTGPGDAGHVRADATEPSAALQIQRARALFHRVGPGRVATAQLAIRLKRDAGHARPSLLVTVYDRELGADLAVRIELPPPKAALEFTPAKGVVTPAGKRLDLYAWAGPDAPKVGRVPAGARLDVEAKRGSWRRVTGLPQDRLAFVSQGDVKPAKGAVAVTGFVGVWQAVPPVITVHAPPAVASGPHLRVQGVASSPRGIRDLWVRVWDPEGKHAQVNKVYYLGGPQGGLRQLRYATDVPLQPGTNYVVVDARDMHGVQGQLRFPVYLPPAADRLTPRPPAPNRSAPATAKDKRPAAKDKGCGCTTGGSSSAWGWLLLGLWLVARARRRHRLRRAPASDM